MGQAKPHSGTEGIHAGPDFIDLAVPVTSYFGKGENHESQDF